MSKPGKRDIDLVRNDNYSHVVTITSDGTTPVNITGRTYSAKIKASVDDTAALLTFTCTVPTGTDGKVTISALPAATNLTPGEFVWDFQELSGTTVTTLLAGRARVVGDVT